MQLADGHQPTGMARREPAEHAAAMNTASRMSFAVSALLIAVNSVLVPFALSCRPTWRYIEIMNMTCRKESAAASRANPNITRRGTATALASPR